MKNQDYYFLEGTYLIYEDDKPSFIIRKESKFWNAYSVINSEEIALDNSWGETFKTKKELLDYAYMGKKITCKKIKRFFKTK